MDIDYDQIQDQLFNAQTLQLRVETAQPSYQYFVHDFNMFPERFVGVDHGRPSLRIRLREGPKQWNILDDWERIGSSIPSHNMGELGIILVTNCDIPFACTLGRLFDIPLLFFMRFWFDVDDPHEDKEHFLYPSEESWLAYGRNWIQGECIRRETSGWFSPFTSLRRLEPDLCKQSHA
jgi:hypothetical protein